jgi:hypothetical protein
MYTYDARATGPFYPTKAILFTAMNFPVERRGWGNINGLSVH